MGETVKGPLHERLRAVLREAYAGKQFKQGSLGRAIGMSQENAGAYLRGSKAGALDLDAADAALRHIGSSLAEFLAGQPPPDLSESQRLAHELEARPELRAFVEALRDVPQTQLAHVLRAVETIAPLATRTRRESTGGSPPAPRPGTRTAKGTRRRR